MKHRRDRRGGSRPEMSVSNQAFGFPRKHTEFSYTRTPLPFKGSLQITYGSMFLYDLDCVCVQFARYTRVWLQGPRPGDNC